MKKNKKHPQTGVSKPRPTTAKFSKKLVPYRHGLHLDLSNKNLDKRTKIGKATIALLDGLREYVGENTVITELIIPRIVFKAIQLHLFEAASIEKPMKDLSPMYLTMTNSLRQDLSALAALSDQGTPPDLKDYIRQAYGKS